MIYALTEPKKYIFNGMILFLKHNTTQIKNIIQN
jgi:hypothetical protein